MVVKPNRPDTPQRAESLVRGWLVGVTGSQQQLCFDSGPCCLSVTTELTGRTCQNTKTGPISGSKHSITTLIKSVGDSNAHQRVAMRRMPTSSAWSQATRQEVDLFLTLPATPNQPIRNRIHIKNTSWATDTGCQRIDAGRFIIYLISANRPEEKPDAVFCWRSTACSDVFGRYQALLESAELNESVVLEHWKRECDGDIPQPAAAQMWWWCIGKHSALLLATSRLSQSIKPQILCRMSIFHFHAVSSLTRESVGEMNTSPPAPFPFRFY